MNKYLLAALTIVAFAGCSASQYEIVDGKMIIEKRAFKSKETCQLEVKSEKPLLVGFDTKISQDVAIAMIDEVNATGDYSKGSTARVASASGPSIGALHGGSIEMPSENGVVKFAFTNLLDHDQDFTVYTSVP